MDEIHRLINAHGAESAKRLITGRERALVDAAACIMSTENPDLQLCYSGFAVTSLPHHRQEDGASWERKSGPFTLILSPGRTIEGGVTKAHSVPYGAIARLILLYLQTEALKTGNPEVALGRSMRQWLDRIGLSVGGKTAAAVREQAGLISISHLQFIFCSPSGVTRYVNDAIVRDAIILPSSGEQSSLWEDKVRLSDTFFQALKDHPVPLAEPAIRAISNDSSALDVYVWLAYRLHRLEEPTPVSWGALHQQFGAGYKLVRQFKYRFPGTLTKARAVYPDADLAMNDSGVILYPSPPPIQKQALRAIGGAA